MNNHPMNYMTKNATILCVAWATSLLACSERPSLGDTTQGADTSTSGDQTSGAPTTGVTDNAPSTGGPGGSSTEGTSTSESPSTGTVSTSSTTSADDTCIFVCDSDTDTVTEECDVFAQDCPEAQKCAPYSESGAYGSKCVPVTGAGQLGDPCLAPEGRDGGFDDCAKGFLCWNTDEQNVGTCIEMCGGTWDAPSCMDEEGAYCHISGGGIINLCLLSCDPLAQDCPNGNTCFPDFEHFTCVLDASGPDGAAFDPCEFANACDPGNLCNDPDLAPMNCDADAIGCCIPLCNLDDNPVCPGLNTTCKPFYEEGTAPPKLENLGVCIE